MSMGRTEVNPRPAGGLSPRATSLWRLRVPRSDEVSRLSRED